MFILVKDIVKIMSEMAPARLAEDWDNVGLQVGRYEKEVRVILCALDFSAEVLEQAAQLQEADRFGLAYHIAVGSSAAGSCGIQCPHESGQCSRRGK